jgi:hypothetical protein
MRHKTRANNLIGITTSRSAVVAAAACTHLTVLFSSSLLTAAEAQYFMTRGQLQNVQFNLKRPK